jgi:hypothetical protein
MTVLRSLSNQARWLALVGGAVLIAGLVIARTLPPGSFTGGATGATDAPETAASTEPIATGSTTYSGCRVLTIEEDRASPSVMLAAMRGVVRAAVVDIDSTLRWATPDGSRPSGATLSTLVAGYRIAHVRVTGVRSGQASVGQVVTVRVQGGSFSGAVSGSPDGCSTIRIDGAAEIAPGADVVLLFGRVPALGATPDAASDAVDVWAVMNGNVLEPDGTTVAASTFAAGGN